jgi:hypothetical protein
VFPVICNQACDSFLGPQLLKCEKRKRPAGLGSFNWGGLGHLHIRIVGLLGRCEFRVCYCINQSLLGDLPFQPLRLFEASAHPDQVAILGDCVPKAIRFRSVSGGHMPSMSATGRVLHLAVQMGRP